MEKFVLTEKIMTNAKTYMSLAEKKDLAKDVALHCIDFIADKSNAPATTFLPFPRIVGENVALKLMLLQNVLLGHYLDIEVDIEKDAWESYDYYGGQHLINQIERYKADAKLKCKAFDLLADYKEFERMVNVEIYNLKILENDVLTRINKTIAVFATPEVLDNFTKQLKDIIENNKEQLAEA